MFLTSNLDFSISWFFVLINKKEKCEGAKKKSLHYFVKDNVSYKVMKKVLRSVALHKTT